MAGQARRSQGGAGALAGNHVVIALGTSGPHVLAAHLRRGSICVNVGDTVHIGQRIGQCGNTVNSTQPDVHVQVTDGTQWSRARGFPSLQPPGH